MNFHRIKTFLFFTLAQLPMKGQTRSIIVRWGGVNIGTNCFVGSKVSFDTINPQNIHIGNGVHITLGVVILTHYLDTRFEGTTWRTGHVYIDDGAFVGANTIICKEVRVGKNSIVASGSVVTKDIPDNEIWGGNPARFIKKR